MKTMTDERSTALSGARPRERADFDTFVAARSTALLRLAYLLTRDHALAEDLLQTTYAKAFTAWRRLRASDDPVAYVHRILINTFLSERRLRRSGEISLAEMPEPDRRSESMSSSDDVAERLVLTAALAELPPLDRAVVVQRYWLDRSLATTAADLGLSEAAVKNRSSRALRRLRELLTDDLTLPRRTP